MTLKGFQFCYVKPIRCIRIVNCKKILIFINYLVFDLAQLKKIPIKSFTDFYFYIFSYFSYQDYSGALHSVNMFFNEKLL